MSRQYIEQRASACKEAEDQQVEPTTSVCTDVHIPRFFGLSETPFLEKKDCVVENQPVGLQNLGSTCWFNVVVQLLYHIPRFRQCILEMTSYQEFISNQHPAVSGLQELFLSIMFSERKLINPSNAVQLVGKILGNAEGQQDASEFLGLVLDRLQHASLLSGVDKLTDNTDKLFLGSLIYLKEAEENRVEDFMQHVLQVNRASSLYSLIGDNIGLLTTRMATCSSLSSTMTPLEPIAEKLFMNIPAVFSLDLCRVTFDTKTSLPVKCNHKVIFQPWLFMDQFSFEKQKEISKYQADICTFTTCKLAKQKKIQSLQSFLENVSSFPAMFDSYIHTVDQSTSIDFKLLTRLNSSWETEIQVKMNELYVEMRLLEEQESLSKNEGVSKLYPYRLHAVIVHQGESNQGHYWIFVWNSVEQCWYHIDDTFTQQVAWEDVSEVAFGGVESDSSAQCLVYIDALQVNHLLDLKEDYEIRYLDPLKYLKDHTDIRTRNVASGKSQSRETISSVISLSHSQPMNGTSLLFKVLDAERRRLFSIARKWKSQSVEDVRLFHIGVYLIVNQVDYEPYVFWSLLQHFASYPLLTSENTTPICNAARHALVFLENSTTKNEKENFMKWNAAYYKFRLIARHLMHAVAHTIGPKPNVAVAVSAAVKALCLHYSLHNLTTGPALSVNSEAIHAVIERSIQSLNNDLLSAGLLTADEAAMDALFDGLKGWCTYSMGQQAKAACDFSREVLCNWRQIADKAITHAAKDATDVDLLGGLKVKLRQLELFLDNLEALNPDTPFEYKGHLSTMQEEGEELFRNWNELWESFHQQHRS